MLRLASIPPIAIAAIVSYVGAYFLLVWTKARRARENLTFAFTCFGVGVYAVACAGLYSAKAPGDGAHWQWFQRLSLGLDGIAFAWFIADYTGRLSRRTLWTLTAWAGMFSLILLVKPNLFLSPEPAIKLAHLPWGATIIYNEVAVLPWGYYLEIFGGALFAAALIAGVRQYRGGERGRAIPLIVAVGVLWAGVLNDIALSFRTYSFVYTIEYAFLALVVMMSFRLAGEHRRVGEMELALRDSEHRYRNLVEGIDDLLLQVDRSGLIHFANRGATEAFAAHRVKLVGRSIFDLAAPDRRERLKQALHDRRGGEPAATEVEVSHVADDGSTLDVLWRFTPVVDEAGGDQRFNAIGRDITERQRSEERVFAHFQHLERQQEAILGLAAHHAIVSGDLAKAARLVAETGSHTLSVERVGVWQTQDDGQQMACLSLYERTPGCHSSGMTLSLQGSHYFDSIQSERVLVAPDALSDPRLLEFRECHLLPKGVGAVLDAPLRVGGRLAGRICIEHTGGPRDWLDDEIIFVGELADQMTQAMLNAERRQAEAERLLLSAAISQAGEAVLVTDPEGRIRYVNPAFERISGYTRTEALGRNLDLLRSAAHDDAFFASLGETLRVGSTWTGRIINRRKDGTDFVQQLIISPVRDDSGAVVNHVAVGRDITAEIEMEDRFRQAQKMEAVGQLAGGVAHDFNNLLTPLLGIAEILLTQLAEDDPVRTSVLDIQQAGERARDLTRQLLAFGRKQVIEMRPLDLGELVTRLASMLERTIREDIEIALHLAPALGLVRADASQIEQIIMNLAVNAQDAMPSGGRLEIETANLELPADDLPGHVDLRSGPYVVLTVRDTGVGLSDEARRHLFEPFFTTKEKGRGTGLGLATVYGIVKQHGGDVAVESAEGRGTTFRIYLPRTEDARQAVAKKPSPPLPVRLGAETVVVAEDDPLVRKLVCAVLRNQGYQVLAAESGEDCLRQAERHPGPIDLLFTDVIMPGMNGRELFQRLSALRPGLRVLFASGHPEAIIAPRGVLEEGVALLVKPYSMRTLVRRVRELLDAAGPAGSPPDRI